MIDQRLVCPDPIGHSGELRLVQATLTCITSGSSINEVIRLLAISQGSAPADQLGVDVRAADINPADQVTAAGEIDRL